MFHHEHRVSEKPTARAHCLYEAYEVTQVTRLQKGTSKLGGGTPPVS